jgi:hypothetical protein
MATIVTIDGIPVYNAIISDSSQGMDKISLIDAPAVKSDFLKFKEQPKQVLFAVADEDKRLVYGVIMRADFPIYRKDDQMGEFYIIYKAETIRQMAEKYLADGKCNNVNLMHQDGSDVEGVQMVQYFIKDSAMGVSPAGFDNISDGSLFGEFHITNDEVWAAVKDGTYKGFSLEGYFDLIPETDVEDVQGIVDTLAGAFSKLFKHTFNMTKLEKIKAALAKVLVECANCTTDKGILYWDGEDDLAVDVPVFTDEAKTTPAEDGEYIKEDGTTIVIKDGKVSEIKPKVDEKPVDAEDGADADPGEGGDNNDGGDTDPGEGDGGEGGDADPDPADGGDGNDGGDAGNTESDLEKRVASLEAIVAKIAEWLGIIVVHDKESAVTETFAAQMAAIKAEIAALKKTPAAPSAHEAFKKMSAEETTRTPGDKRCVTRKTL